MRGERSPFRRIWSASHGSSPHARGTLLFLSPLIAAYRFIPACAGNAWPGGHRPLSPPVHPRMRGERISGRIIVAKSQGSSPHARGTPVSVATTGTAGRFIPACAGNAGLPRRLATGAAVHPRMRGERIASVCPARQIGGSSPHARGTHRMERPRRPIRRFIPACAGNAPAQPTSRFRPPVHPRMRGERCL